LKDAEEEVGHIVRDREILCVVLFFFFLRVLYCFFRVTRLVKASNSKKSGTGNIRESLLLNRQRFPSSSSLSLSIGGESLSPSPSRASFSPHLVPESNDSYVGPLSASFSSSTKLAAAQSELQACETHLAAKERELAIKRCTAIPWARCPY
jgi:hypothetical protein